MDEYDAIDELGVDEPAAGTAEAFAIRMVVTPDEGRLDDSMTEDLELLDAGAAEAVSDISDRRGPDEDDAESWVNEVQGR